MSEMEKAALEPFAELYALCERNNYLEGVDFIMRQDGRVLGHAGFCIDDLRRCYDAFVKLGGAIS